MDPGSVFLILALLIPTALFIAKPLYERRVSSMRQMDHGLSSLLAERDRILDALQELDFDYALEKVPDNEYAVRREGLVQRGAEVLRQLDERGAASAPDETSAHLSATMEEKHVSADSVEHDDKIEAMIATRRQEREGKLGGFCPQCGGPLSQSDKYCPKCGTSLT